MKKFATLLFVAIFALTANAQLLWKVTGNGLKSPSYIFGTHHVASPTLIDSISGLKDALLSADLVAGELDMTDMTDPVAMQKMTMMLMAPADSTLSTLLSKDELNTIDAYIKDLTGGQASIAMMEMLKPSAIISQLAILESARIFPDFNPTQQLDATIQAMAKEAGKKIIGLENLDFQMNLLYGAPLDKQAKDLLEAASHREAMANQSREMATAYVAVDIDALLNIMNDPQYGMDENEAKLMIYDRNRNWAMKLMGIMPMSKVFVAVGAGHLPGDKGLLQLIRNMGFTVTPVE